MEYLDVVMGWCSICGYLNKFVFKEVIREVVEFVMCVLFLMNI